MDIQVYGRGYGHEEMNTVRNVVMFMLLLTMLSVMPASSGAAQQVEESGPVTALGTPLTSVTPGTLATAEDIFVLSHPSHVSLGQPFAVRLTSSRPLGEVSLSWQGKTVKPSISVWNGKHVTLALLGTDVLHSKAGVHDLVITARVDGDLREFSHPVAVQQKQYPEQRLTLEQKMVTAPATEDARIAEDRKAVAAALASMSPERRWALPILRPVPGKTTSPYGYRRILNGQPKNPHRGLDFRAAMGEPVMNCADGVVVLAAEHYYAGNSVYVDHGNGVVSMYFHLSELKVTVGQTVERGAVVGLAGATGRATGPHLHFGVAVQGRMVDPQTLISSSVDELLK